MTSVANNNQSSLEQMKRDRQNANIPVQLNIKNIISDQETRVETEVIDPLTSTQSVSRFVLPNKGILDAKTSKLIWSATIPAKDSNGDDVNARFTNTIGGLSLIKSIRLLIGGNEVSFINDLNQYSVAKRLFRTLDNQNSRGSALVKCNSDLEWYNDNNKRFLMPISIGNEGETTIGRDLTANASTTPKCCESLSDLLPFFSKGSQYPLFLSKQEVVLEIEWDTDGNGLIYADNSKRADLTIQPPQLYLDLMYYGEDVLDLMYKANSGKGLSFQYNDIMEITHNVATGSTSDTVFLGMANRTIDRMWVQKDDNGYDAVGMGKFRSVVDEGQNWNLRVNEELLFETPVSNRALEYNYMCDTIKKPFNSPIGGFQGGNNTWCGGGGANQTLQSVGNLTTNTTYVKFAPKKKPSFATFSNWSPPSLEVTGGTLVNSGIQATVSLELDPATTRFVAGSEVAITTKGTYTNGDPPTAVVDNKHGATTDPTFTVTMNAGGTEVDKVVINNAGEGFTDIPTFKFVNPASNPPTAGNEAQPVAFVVTDFEAKSKATVSVVTNGRGYTAVPTCEPNPADAGIVCGTCVLNPPINSDDSEIDVRSALKGTMNYLGVDFTVYNNGGGTKVGQVPIEFVYNRSGGNGRLMRFWISYEKSFTLLNGQANIDQN